MFSSDICTYSDQIIDYSGPGLGELCFIYHQQQVLEFRLHAETSPIRIKNK